MNQHSTIMLLQLVKAMKTHGWASDSQWELSLKADGHVPLIRQVEVHAEMDDKKWKDQVSAMVNLRITTEDEITFFPSITVYAQIAIGSIPPEDIEYATAGNESFTEKDIKDHTKFKQAAAELTRIVDNYINEIYGNYVTKNDELIRFYNQSSSGVEM